jgi:multimeric flavodoxin WrbA
MFVNILILNGSPRANGNTSAMIAAFRQGAESKGHMVTAINVCEKQIAGCLACEYCHTTGHGACKQQDDMHEVYTALESAELLVLASPIYHFSLSGQLQCAINRTYAVEDPKWPRKTMLFLSSGSSDVFDGAIYEYRKSFREYLGLEDMGIFTAYGAENKSPALLARLKAAGEAI